MGEPTEPTVPSTAAFGALAAELASERNIALRALQVLEYALTAPAPRRHRTWVHRVSAAIDALNTALRAQLPTAEHPVLLLDEIALANPEHLPKVRQLRQELLDLTIVVASLREQAEPDPTIPLDPADFRDRLAAVTRRFRQLRAGEAALVHDATGFVIDDQI